MLRRLLIRDVATRWYVVALFLPATIDLAALTIDALVSTGPHAPAQRRVTSLWTPELQVAAAIFFLGTALGEEIGWRAYALPRLQSRMNALQASLAIGAVWTLWHAPLFVTRGTALAGIPLRWFACQMFSTSILLTWIFNGTGGSVLLCVMFHATTNFWTGRLGLTPYFSGSVRPYQLSVLVEIAAAVAIVARFGARSLSGAGTRVT